MKREQDWKVWMRQNGFRQKVLKRLIRLEPLEKPEDLWKKFWGRAVKRCSLILGASIAMMVLFAVSEQEEFILQEGNRLSRPSYNEAEQEVEIWAGVETEENIEEITLSIAPEKYTFEEFEAVVKKAITGLEDSILGANVSLETITENLILPGQIPDTLIEILWTSDNEDIVTAEGIVNREAVGESGAFVVLNARFVYEEYKMNHSFGLHIEPELLSEPERLRKKLWEKMEAAFLESSFEEEIILPDEIEGKKVIYKEKRTNGFRVFPLFFLTGIVLWVMGMKEEMEKQEKEREKQLFMDYPELVSQFTLLLSAGMTIGGAWKRLVDQYEKHQRDGRKRRYVYEEMTITWREMQNGISETEAIKRFGKRIKLIPYMKFASLLSQNLRKGSKGLVGLLKTEAGLAQEERKETAKQLGEEAGTKLLFPMLMMFGIVLLMILVPAFMSF